MHYVARGNTAAVRGQSNRATAPSAVSPGVLLHPAYGQPSTRLPHPPTPSDGTILALGTSANFRPADLDDRPEIRSSPTASTETPSAARITSVRAGRRTLQAQPSLNSEHVSSSLEANDPSIGADHDDRAAQLSNPNIGIHSASFHVLTNYYDADAELPPAHCHENSSRTETCAPSIRHQDHQDPHHPPDPDERPTGPAVVASAAAAPASPGSAAPHQSLHGSHRMDGSSRSSPAVTKRN
jgi:hypothetical protein